MRPIREIDKDIDANMKTLWLAAGLATRPRTAAGAQRARDLFPVLDARDHNLYRERGEAQRIRDAAEHDRAMRTARAANRVARKTYQATRCPQCGAVA